MIRRGAGLALACACLLTGGCVAAAVPVVAGGLIARDRLNGPGDAPRQKSRKAKKRAGDEPAFELKTPEGRAALAAMEGATLKAAPGGLPSPSGVIPTALTAMPAPDGSIAPGEASALALQAYQGLWTHLSDQSARRGRGEPVRSVVLASGATLDAPSYVECGAKPLAILVDLDEDPAKSADPDARWRRWKGDGSDLLVATPGAVEGMDAARRAGIAVVFMTARSPDSAPSITATLSRLGFGSVEPSGTLQMRGAVPGDIARRSIAETRCVVALVGDTLSDFSDLLTPAAGAAAVADTMVAPLWGAGWFLLPNPVRSTAPASNASNGDR